MDKCVGGAVKVAGCAFESREGMFESWVGASLTFLYPSDFMGSAFASFGNAFRGQCVNVGMQSRALGCASQSEAHRSLDRRMLY